MSLRFLMILIGLSFGVSPALRAQDGAPKELRKDWLEKDIANARRMRPIFPLKDLDYNKFKAALKPEHSGESLDLGFGVRLEQPSVLGGYTSWRLRVAVYEGRILQFDMLCSASAAEVRREIEKIWGSEDFREEGHDEKGLAAWQARINAALGAGPGAVIPESLKAAMEDLRSPLKNLIYSKDGIGMGVGRGGGRGPRPADPSVTELKEARRYDLVQELLRSPNPISRIHAAEALLEARTEGRALSVEDKKAITLIREMEQSYTRVEGCIASNFRAKDVLADPNEEPLEND